MNREILKTRLRAWAEPVDAEGPDAAYLSDVHELRRRLVEAIDLIGALAFLLELEQDYRTRALS